MLMAVATYARQTDAFVIAEGIEDDEVLDFVTTLPARTGNAQICGGQGYGLGRPDSQLPTAGSLPRPAGYAEPTAPVAAGPSAARIR
jgi:EAL domain-containing protein (putative c-di-GMP-specific phosphodiesterase class I)